MDATDGARTAAVIECVERSLEVTGEAVRNILEALLTDRPEELWDTATGDMEALEVAINAILEAEPEGPE